MLKTRQPAPPLSVPTLDGGTFTLAEAKPKRFTLVVAYRGRHCPACSRYLGELEALLPEFAARGIEVIAVSMDQQDRAAESKQEWGLANTQIGYGLTEEAARAWGLAISTSRGETSIGIEETARFSEPGCSWCAPTARSISPPRRRCPSPGRILPTC